MYQRTTCIGGRVKADKVEDGGPAGEERAGLAVLDGERLWGVFGVLRIPATAYDQGVAAGGGGGAVRKNIRTCSHACKLIYTCTFTCM